MGLRPLLRPAVKNLTPQLTKGRHRALFRLIGALTETLDILHDINDLIETLKQLRILRHSQRKCFRF